MDIKTIPAVIVGVMVALAIVGATMPIWADTLASEDTLTNAGYYRMEKVTSDDETVYTLTWNKSEDIIRVNNEVINMEDKSTYASLNGVSVVMTDNTISRYVPGLRIQSWISGQGGSIGYNGGTMDIELNQGTITITFNKGLETEAVKTSTYTTAYIVSNVGDYVMKKSTTDSYVKEDTELYAMGVTTLNTSNTPVLSVLKMTGDASSVEFSAIYGLSDDPVFSNVTIDKTDNNSYVDLYNLKKITATVTYDSADTDITYSFFIVPYEVTAERAVYMGGPLGALVSIIPLLIIAGLVIGAVTWFMLRKG